MALFNNPKKTVILVVIFLTLLIGSLFLAKSHAGDLVPGPSDAPYVQVDTGAAIIRGAAPILGIDFTEPATVLRNAFWEEALDIEGSSKWHNIDAPNNMILRGMFLDGIGHTDFGIGVSYTMNPYPYNGSNMNYNLQIDYRFTRLPVTLTYMHSSNAGATATNVGRDIILVGWRFH